MTKASTMDNVTRGLEEFQLQHIICDPMQPLILNALTLNILYNFIGFHTSSVQAAVTKFGMPAMSPTMTEGTIIKWKKKEGKHRSSK